MTIHRPQLLEATPPQVKRIFQALLKKGDEAMLVGGCVRDMLCNKEITDYDFATKYLPEETQKILLQNNIKSIPTGLKHGTITAVVDGWNFEITTLRKDIETDGRRSTVEFVDDYYFDAARRDFTINALYLDNSGFIHDYFGGINDLKLGKVKFIGDANKRIEEDFLRILRFFRFSCYYAQTIDNKGLQACVKYQNHLNKLSADRIRNEFLKTISCGKNSNVITTLSLFNQTEISNNIFATKLDVSSFKSLLLLEKELSLAVNSKMRFFVLVANSNSQEIATKLNFSNADKKYFQFLAQQLSSKTLNWRELKMLLAFYEKDLVAELYLAHLACCNGVTKEQLPDIGKNYSLIKSFTLPQFPITAQDLQSLGYKNEQIGNGLKLARNLWAKNNFIDGKEQLLKELKSH